MIDVAMRHGVNEYTIKKWNETFEIQKYFEERIGKSIYSVLPNVIENTFGFWEVLTNVFLKERLIRRRLWSFSYAAIAKI